MVACSLAGEEIAPDSRARSTGDLAPFFAFVLNHLDGLGRIAGRAHGWPLERRKTKLYVYTTCTVQRCWKHYITMHLELGSRLEKPDVICQRQHPADLGPSKEYLDPSKYRRRYELIRVRLARVDLVDIAPKNDSEVRDNLYLRPSLPRAHLFAHELENARAKALPVHVDVGEDVHAHLRDVVERDGACDMGCA